MLNVDKNLEALLIKQIAKVPNSSSVNFLTGEDIARLGNSGTLGCADIVVITELRDIDNLSFEDRNLGIDLETTGFNPLTDNIVGIGLSDGVSHVYIDLSKGCSSDLTHTITCTLERLFSNADKVLAHNAKFEHKFIQSKYGVGLPADKLVDTMVLAYLLDYPMKLSTLAGKVLARYPMQWLELCDKAGTLDATAIPIELIAPYCCEDAYECVLLYDKLRDTVESHFGKVVLNPVDLKPVPNIVDTDTRNMVSVGNMELAGIRLDLNKLQPFIDTVENIKEDLVNQFVCIVGNSDALGSPAKMSRLLYEKLKLPTTGINKGKSGLYSTDKASLNELSGLHPVIDVVQDIAVVTKLSSMMRSKAKDDKGIVNIMTDEGVLFPNTNTTVTATGRWSMSNPNLQQSPNPMRYKALNNKAIAVLGKMFRELIIPRVDGNVLVVSDYPSFEFRIIATLSDDKTLRDIFNNYLDFHVVICEKLFGITYDKGNPEHKVFRQLTKTINFGVAYGMTHVRLQRECLKAGMNYSTLKCQGILSDYWSVLNGVYAFFCREKLRALIEGYSLTMFGRKRFFTWRNQRLVNYVNYYLSGFDYANASNSQVIDEWERLVRAKVTSPDDEGNFRMIQNAPIQGTNADVIRIVINRLDQEYENLSRVSGLPCYTAFTVHDEFVVESHPEIQLEVSERLKSAMETSVTLSVPLIVQPVVCGSWGDAK